MGGGGDTSVDETSMERELADIAGEKWTRRQEAFIPAEDVLIEKATDLDRITQKAQDVASVDYGAQFAAGEDQLAANMAARGAAPGSGAFSAGTGSYGLGRGQSMAAGQGDVQSRSKDIYSQNLQGLVSYGQGQSAGAISGYGSAAEMSSKQAQMDAEAQLASQQALGETVGTGIGYGIGKYGGG